MQSKNLRPSAHHVFIVDNDGMSVLYPYILGLLKDEQISDSHLTVLYLSDASEFIFKEELFLLTTRFPQRFIVLYKKKYEMVCLENIINSNTKKQICFQIATRQEQQETIVSQLRFLDIPLNDISILDQQVNSQ